MYQRQRVTSKSVGQKLIVFITADYFIARKPSISLSNEQFRFRFAEYDVLLDGRGEPKESLAP